MNAPSANAVSFCFLVAVSLFVMIVSLGAMLPPALFGFVLPAGYGSGGTAGAQGKPTLVVLQIGVAVSLVLTHLHSFVG